MRKIIFSMLFFLLILSSFAHASTKIFTLTEMKANTFFYQVGNDAGGNRYYIYDNETIKFRTPEGIEFLTLKYTWDDALYGGGGGAVLKASSPALSGEREMTFEDDIYQQYDDLFNDNKIGAQFDECEYTSGGCAEVQYLKIWLSQLFIAQIQAYAANTSATSAGNPLSPNTTKVISVMQNGAAIQKINRQGLEAYQLENDSPVQIVIEDVKANIIFSNTPINAGQKINEIAPGAAQSTKTIANLDQPIKIDSKLACIPRPSSLYRCVITINQFNGKKFTSELESYSISVASGAIETLNPTDYFSITLLTKGIDYQVTQGTTVIAKTPSGFYELINNDPIKIVFTGTRKDSRKYIAAPEPSESTNFNINQNAAASPLPTPAELGTNAIYQTLASEIIITNIRGKEIQENTKETIVLAYDSDVDGINEVTALKFRSNKEKLSIVVKSQDGVLLKRDEDIRLSEHNYLIEKDGAIALTIGNIKEGRKVYLSSSNFSDTIARTEGTRPRTLIENDGVNLKFGNETVIVETQKPESKCTRNGAVFSCTITIKQVDSKPITKSTEPFSFWIGYDADGDGSLAQEEGTFVGFSAAAPPCTTLLECLAQLDKTIASKYLD